MQDGIVITRIPVHVAIRFYVTIEDRGANEKWQTSLVQYNQGQRIVLCFLLQLFSIPLLLLTNPNIKQDIYMYA